MPPETRAVVFDLDDTLYPYRRYRASGFAAVALHLERTRGFDARIALASLLRASRGASRGRELQDCIDQHALPAGDLDELLDVFRRHEPAIALPAAGAVALHHLRADGWRIGVLTNGLPDVQRRKVAALGLGALVDEVVYATEHGSGMGKPEAAGFAEIVRALRVPAARSVFVGNDERCDVAGAHGAGMHPVLCVVWTARPDTTSARRVVDRLEDVPAVASFLLAGASNADAA